MLGLLVPLALAVVFFAVIALVGGDGLWSNFILLVNVTLAALLATNFFEPLATFISGYWAGGGIFLDLFALWFLFIMFLIVMRVASDMLSRTRVRFQKHLDVVGGFVCAAFAGWVLVCFTTMTFHTAPLARNFMSGGFTPETPVLFGFAPDRLWLGFSQRMSQGTFTRGPEHVFDPRGDFMIRYATRREKYDKSEGMFLQ
jgi:hypothetical protein